MFNYNCQMCVKISSKSQGIYEKMSQFAKNHTYIHDELDMGDLKILLKIIIIKSKYK